MDPSDLIKTVAPLQCPINGRYDALQLVGGTGGDGNFSVVFGATDLNQNRQVALKFFVDRGDAFRLASFEREGRLLATMFRDEPHFVQTMQGVERLVFAVSGPGGITLPFTLPFIALEWMPNGSAKPFCRAPTTVTDLLRRLSVLRSMCRCVQRLHNLGCAHRDLKPDNFLMGRADAVKLADFGTAKLLAPNEPNLAVNYPALVGDMRYAAPEVLAGIVVDRRAAQLADVYSLGAIFFEMLTGQKLFVHTLKTPLEIKAFIRTMQSVGESNRREVFHKFIDTTSWRIPRVRGINSEIPKIVHHQLDELVQGLAQLDYRLRVDHLEIAHRKAKLCELLLRVEQRRRERRARKQREGATHA